MTHKTQHITIATRKSPLAMWQATYIKNILEKHFPHITVQLRGLVTTGDKETNLPLTALGGKSLFVKELQHALLNHEADIAVHSIKDLPVSDHSELMLAAITAREDPRDAFISNQAKSLTQLPQNASVGTASPRRQSLIKSLRPDLNVALLRGNVGTRLEKLDAGEFDAIILASAGLKRLGFQNRIQEYLDPNYFIPAIGQGALGIECRQQDKDIQMYLQVLHDLPTAYCVTAERAVNQMLGGDCHTPLGAHATLQQQQLSLNAVIASADGRVVLRANCTGHAESAVTLGRKAALDLLNQGANTFISKY